MDIFVFISFFRVYNVFTTNPCSSTQNIIREGDTMLEFKPVIRQILTEVESAEANYKKAFQNCPKGSLQMFYDHGRPQFMQVAKIHGKRARRGINRNKDLLRGLARKEFLRASLEQLEQNNLHLSRTLDETEDYDVEHILQLMRHRFPGLPEEYFLDSEAIEVNSPYTQSLLQRLDAHREWAAMPYEKSTYRPEGLRIRTSQGLRVRSKSEAMIAEKYYDYGIPFRFEQVLHIGSSILIPDFTFEAADGSEIYWEHAGMLDHPQYSFRHHLKMMQYESAGIYPWQNLIVSYDTGNNINMQIIDDMIRDLLIPLL